MVGGNAEGKLKLEREVAEIDDATLSEGDNAMVHAFPFSRRVIEC